MKILSLLIALVFTLSFLSWNRAEAYEEQASTIPVRKSAAVKALKNFSDAIGLPEKISSKITEDNFFDDTFGGSHLQYVIQIEGVLTLAFDACSGNITLTSLNTTSALTQEEANAARPKWMTEGQVKARCQELQEALLPKAKQVYFSLVSGRGVYDPSGDKKNSKYQGLDESTASYVVYQGSIMTSNHLVVTIERGSGTVRMVILTNVNFPPKTEGFSKIPDTFFNSDQENIWQTNDDWFLSKELVIKGLDTDQLRFIGSNSYFDYYAKDTLALDECAVMYNEEPLTSKMSLFVRPKVREANPLIYVSYFPNFLIATKREGDTITLRGQLPNKGHQAIVKIGSKDATVDGKPFTLSGAPQEIDGRLYLPYELLHQCNGVLVRWDAGKNTLWVDTRYLRRP